MHSAGPQLTPVGSGLVRPECVLATASGDLYTSDSRGGVAHLRPDGSAQLYAGHSADLGETLVPNGIALQPDGSFLIAHLGATTGGVFQLDRGGNLRPVLQQIDGVELPPTNFVAMDRLGRRWVTVSTRIEPRADDYRPDASSGFIVLDDGHGPRIVVDGLGYVNECALSPDGSWLYVNETFARCLSRFPLTPDGQAGGKEVVARFGAGQFPDGLALAVDGSVWVACVIANCVLRVDPEGGVTTVIDEGEPRPVVEAEQAYLRGEMGAGHLEAGATSRLGNCSSVAFGGADRRTAFLGSLSNDHLLSFAAPVAGVELAHWRGAA